jgi:beta-lactamase regulating signal transducer with metallopeptidase domain
MNMNLTHLGGGVFRWVLQSSWQAAVLAVLILLAQGLLRKRLAPSWRYGLWLLLVARLLMPVPPQSAFSIFNLARTVPAYPPGAALQPTIGADPYFVVNSFNGVVHLFNGTARMDLHAMTEPRDDPSPPPSGVTIRPASQITWFKVGFWGWLAGACFFGARLVWTNARFCSRIGGYQPSADENVTRLFNECRAAFNITQPVRMIESEEVESPAVYGLWRKWLLLPDGIFERFSSEELRHIFLHELAHIKRRDIEVNWLTALLRILHWFNPMIWLAFARMRADRELATDALALTHVAGTENVSYGETILKVVENLVHRAIQPGLVGIAESKAGLKERLRAIARIGAAKHWRWAALGMAAIVAGVGLTDAQQTHSSDPALRKEVVTVSHDPAPDSQPTPHISGRVVDPAGHPVAGAQLALYKPHSLLSLTGEPRLFNPMPSPHLMGGPQMGSLPWNYCTTDAQGRFFLDDLDETLFLLVANEIGYARVATNDFSPNMAVKLEPWGRIEGTFWHYDEAVTNQSVSAGLDYDGTSWSLGQRFNKMTDGHGRFSFEYVPAGRFSVVDSLGMAEHATVKPGQTTVVKLGGSGRAVVGKFQKIRNPYVQFEWGNEFGYYLFMTAPSETPKRFRTKEDLETWRKQPEVERQFETFHSRRLECAKDGSFRIDQVDPGKYELAVTLFNPKPKTFGSEAIGGYEGTFDVPSSPPNTRQPLDLGVIEVFSNYKVTNRIFSPVREQIFTNTLGLGFLWEPADFFAKRPPSLVTDFIRSEFDVGDFHYMAGDGLFCVDMKLIKLKPTDWSNLDADQVAARLAAAPGADRSLFDPDPDKAAIYGFQVYHNSVKLKYPANGPAVYGFQTRQKLMGLLQISPLTDNPPGIKMLYKLVRNGDGASP